MKLKIVEPGWVGYTGLLGDIPFTNAISDRDISEQEALRIGSILRVEEVTASGEEVGQVSVTAEMIRTKDIGAPVVAPLPRSSELVSEDLTAPAPVVPKPLESEKPEPTKVFTLAELEAVADQQGIKGLRDIATPLGLKDSAIPGLIEKIIEFQKKNPPKAE